MNETLTPADLLKEGKSAYQQGDYAAAAKAYKAAANSYTEAGDELSAAEMHNNSSVAYLLAGDKLSALETVQGTDEIFAAAGDIRRQGLALGNLGAALEADNRLDKAIEAYSQSADLLKQAGEDDLRLNVMQSLSAIQMRTGRQLEALVSMQAGLEGVEKPNTRQRLIKKFLKLPYRFLGRP